MVVQVEKKEKFSGLASKALLAEMREIARRDGRTFESVLEDAMRAYVSVGGKTARNVRPEVMAHYYASVERNRLLYELLAE